MKHTPFRISLLLFVVFTIISFPHVVHAAAPTVIFSVTPSKVVAGSEVLLHWESTNATTCTLENKPDDITQERFFLNEYLVTTPTSNQKYTVVCEGPDGTVSKTEKVIMHEHGKKAPTLGLSLTNETYNTGTKVKTADLTWVSTNSDSCTEQQIFRNNRLTFLIGSFSQDTSGTEAITGTTGGFGSVHTRYIFTCEAPIGSIMKSVNF